jgi:hypothetical protein
MDALDRIYRAVFSMFVLVAVLVLAGAALMLLGRIVSAIPGWQWATISIRYCRLTLTHGDGF